MEEDDILEVLWNEYLDSLEEEPEVKRSVNWNKE